MEQQLHVAGRNVTGSRPTLEVGGHKPTPDLLELATRRATSPHGRVAAVCVHADAWAGLEVGRLEVRGCLTELRV